MKQTVDFLRGVWARLDGFTLLFASVFFAALCSVAALVFFAVQKAMRRKRLRCAEMERDVIFTLPDRENSFIRDRLNTALRSGEKPISHKLAEEGFRADHARALIAKLKAAPLSVAERIEVDGVSSYLTECAFKNELEWEEIARLNERLCSALKLAAKYSL